MATIDKREAVSPAHPIAYFSAEFGFDAQLPIYAGGLGILAGDVMKQAGDENFPVIGVGLLYRGNGMKQGLDAQGRQIDLDWDFDPVAVGLEHVYLDNLPLFVSVHIGDALIWLRVWKKTFSSTVTLYLLDSETEQNTLAERSSTHALYSGAVEYMFVQAMLLGIGGVKVLTSLGIHPSIFHLNEGRPAFLHWQLVRQFMDFHGLSYDTARQLAREKTVYTNHTLVGAANLSLATSKMCYFANYYAGKMRIPCEELLAQGRENGPDDFNITRFALNVSNRANGVSTLHSELSAQQWPEYHWCNVTNGVHLPTWQSNAIVTHKDDLSTLWQAHLDEKRLLAEYVQQSTGFSINPDQLFITWSRRLAGYKRLDALFNDLERLAKILKRTDRPVQLLVSGKAHQGDQGGKDKLQEVIGHFSKELAGQALFIPNYNVEVAQKLTRGSDVWLNTPEIGREACGTSGMKALSNGVLQCTVADGWAAEVDWKNIGWTLDSNDISNSIYTTLETAIVPMFYERENAFPQRWVAMMQASIALANRYSAQQMLANYRHELYQIEE